MLCLLPGGCTALASVMLVRSDKALRVRLVMVNAAVCGMCHLSENRREGTHGCGTSAATMTDVREVLTTACGRAVKLPKSLVVEFFSLCFAKSGYAARHSELPLPRETQRVYQPLPRCHAVEKVGRGHNLRVEIVTQD